MRGAATAALAKLTSTGKVELTTVPPLVLDVALLIVSANIRLLLWQKSASPLLFLATILTSMLVYKREGSGKGKEGEREEDGGGEKREEREEGRGPLT